MWDGGWDNEPRSVPDGGPAADPGSAAGPGKEDVGGGWPADGVPPPRRWYSPATQRGKVILVVTVAIVLIATLIGCCAGIGGLSELRRIDMTDWI